jgi:hypothetical protein
MAQRKTYHVVPNPKGGWDVKKGGAQRASSHFDTKKEAAAAGREISRNQGSELIIHGKNGRVQSMESRELTLKAFQKAYDSHHRDKKH